MSFEVETNVPVEGEKAVFEPPTRRKREPLQKQVLLINSDGVPTKHRFIGLERVKGAVYFLYECCDTHITRRFGCEESHV